MKKKVMLLGAGGQLGKQLMNIAPQEVSLFPFAHNDLDISDESDLKRTLKITSPDLIINTAAYTDVDQAESEQAEAFAVNAVAVQALSGLVDEKTKILHLSTDFVFSKLSLDRYTPESQTSPTCVYGQSKLAGEQYLLERRPETSIVLRTSWLYSSAARNFVTVMLDLMSSREEISVVNDQFGSPTSADTLGEVVWSLAGAENACGIYHWSDRGVITWYDFALEIQKQAFDLGLIKKKIPVKPIPSHEFPTSATRPAYSALDSSSTEKLIGMETIPWENQLKKQLEKFTPS